MDGIATFSKDGYNGSGYSVGVEPGGKVAAAGYTNTSTGYYDALVVQYETNGTLDSGFTQHKSANPLDNWTGRPTDTNDHWYTYSVGYGSGAFELIRSFHGEGPITEALASSDGSTWVSRLFQSDSVPVPYIYSYLYGMAYGSNTFVAVGTNNNFTNIYTLSANDPSANWIGQVTWSGDDLYAVAYGDNRFVAVGNNGTILKSEDSSGNTWSVVDGNKIYYLEAVAYGNNRFVTVGQGGIILTSTSSDASTWTTTILRRFGDYT